MFFKQLFAKKGGVWLHIIFTQFYVVLWRPHGTGAAEDYG